MIKSNKNILLLIGFVLAIIICYKFSITKTLALKTSYENLKQEAFLFENTPKQILILNKKQKYLDSILSKYKVHGQSIQNNLLKTITNFSDENDLVVVSFQEPHKFIIKDESVITTYNFTLKGSYNNIIKLVYHLERYTKFGEVVNLNFNKKKNYKTGKYYLEASVLLRSYR